MYTLDVLLRKDNTPILRAMVESCEYLTDLAEQNRQFYWELGYQDPYKAVTDILGVVISKPQQYREWLETVCDVYERHNDLFNWYHKGMK